MNRSGIFTLASAVVAISLGIYFAVHDNFPAESKRALEKSIRDVVFAPHVDRVPVTITDQGTISEITQAILGGRKVSIGSYPPTSCSLRFNFADGTSESFLISPTGITAKNFFQQDPDSFKGMSYAMIKWRGFYRACDSKPFLDILKERHLISAEGIPNPSLKKEGQ